MTHIRRAAVAGFFYPQDPGELQGMVQHLLADPPPSATACGTPKALIVPHAGYIYSGPIAASAYVCLKDVALDIQRVVLIGPCHRVPLRGLALSSADAFETPLGIVSVDTQAIAALRELPQVTEMDAAHANEHSLEVHLPFLQQILARFTVVPIVAGHASAEQVADVLDLLWGGPETLVVISSDLSHFHDYETARQLDSATCRAIESLDPAPIGFDAACGSVAVRGLLSVARRRGLAVSTLDLRNSGDTQGNPRRVVGYGAWMFCERAACGGESVRA